jgi:hypothetical protein
VINMATGNKKRKRKKFNRGGKSTRVQEVRVPGNQGSQSGNKKRKRKKFNRGGKSTRVQEVRVPGNQGSQSDHDNDDSDKTADMSGTGFVEMDI